MTLKCGDFKLLVVGGIAEHGRATLFDRLLGGKRSPRALDGLRSDLENGIPASVRFRGKKPEFRVVDTSGHRLFAKNLVAGTTRPDCLLIVVSAKEDEFERARNENGPILGLFRLSAELGIRSIVVAINKMDLYSDNNDDDLSRDRFLKIETALRDTLERMIPKSETSIAFVPVSGLRGTNVNEQDFVYSWYSKGTLIDVLEAASEPTLATEKPLKPTRFSATPIAWSVVWKT